MTKLSMRRKGKTENEPKATTTRPNPGTSQRPVSGVPIEASPARYSTQQIPPSREPDYRPVILSIQDQEWVHQRILVVYGRAGPDVPFDGQVIVDHHNNSFPPQGFPITNSHFKALVHLVPGPNNIKFTFIPPQEISTSRFTSRITLHYLPLLQNPPIHLAIVLANDSEGHFESPPDRPSGLEDAVKKLRVAAYLWQAYTAEQMYRNFPGTPGNGGSARRSFRLEEEWAEDTLSLQESDIWRMTAKVHIVRSELTVEEMHEQSSTEEGKGLKGLVRDALDHYGAPFKLGEGYKGPNPIVLCLLLDSHWRDLMAPGKVDHENKLRLGVFISRTLWSWPSYLEEVVPAFQDDVQIAPSSPGLGPSNSYYGSPFEAASAGIGGMLRELGYTFGCLPEDPGSSLRSLHTFHRTFITREGKNSRTQLQGLRPCLPAHESSWHRLDCVQFRYHPCFRLPVEGTAQPDQIMYWPCENGLIVTAPTGIILVVIRVPQKSFPVAWFEYPDRPEREAFLFESDLVEKMPQEERGKDIQIEVVSAGGGRVRVDWKWVMRAGKTHISQLSTEIFRSRMVGRRTTEGSVDSGDFIFKSRYMTSALVNIRISHARSLYSIEFQYADGSASTFGTPHPRTKGTDIPIDHAAGEAILGFHIRASDWIDAIKVITNRKRSVWLGHLGGSDRVFEMVPPQGYEMIGVYGRHGRCCDAFGIIYTTNA